jgi:hypothetical protein
VLEPTDDGITWKRTPREGEIGSGAAVERAELERGLRPEPLRLPASPANEILQLLPRLTLLIDE